VCPPSQGRRNHLPKGQNRSHGPYQVVNVRFFDVGLRVVFRCIDIWNSLALLMGIVLPFACCLDIYKPRDDVILHKPSWNQVSRKDSSWSVIASEFVEMEPLALVNQGSVSDFFFFFFFFWSHLQHVEDPGPGLNSHHSRDNLGSLTPCTTRDIQGSVMFWEHFGRIPPSRKDHPLTWQGIWISVVFGTKVI